MLVMVVMVLMLSVVFCAHARAQGVTVNGIELPEAQANLNITIDVIEVREGSDPVLRLAAGKKRYKVSLLSPTPIRMFDVEFPLAQSNQRHFDVKIEDGREFVRCLVTGLKSSGADPDRPLVYALTCEDVSPPPLYVRDVPVRTTGGIGWTTRQEASAKQPKGVTIVEGLISGTPYWQRR
jgi:hypothetical protein